MREARITSIKFIPLQESHLQLLYKWLETPHVKAWWDQDIQYTLDLVKEKFSKHAHNRPISSVANKLIYAYIVHLGDVPVGYIQAYNALSFLEANDLNTTLIPALSASADFFIGEQEFLGKGLGSQILNAFWKKILSPYFNCCLVDPDANNQRAIRVYEKAGFRVLKKAGNDGILWMIREKPGTKENLNE